MLILLTPTIIVIIDNNPNIIVSGINTNNSVISTIDSVTSTIDSEITNPSGSDPATNCSVSTCTCSYAAVAPSCC